MKGIFRILLGLSEGRLGHATDAKLGFEAQNPRFHKRRKNQRGG